jgi:hypothetical protein
MHTSEIREFCHHCGHRAIRKFLPGANMEMPTDYCTYYLTGCSELSRCDPDVRIPKTRKRTRTIGNRNIRDLPDPYPEDMDYASENQTRET